MEGATTTSPAISKPESSVLASSAPEPPVRILVATLTHLVPGNGNIERTDFILNQMCRYHWNCDFSTPRFRWAAYNNQFAFRNQRCFFVVDYGESLNDDEVPVLSYEWTGVALKLAPRLAKDPKIEAKLKSDFPFTWRPSKREKPPMRKRVQIKLRTDDPIPPHEFEYMRQHPEDMEWLKDNVKLGLWQKFVRDANRFKPPGTPDISL